MVVLLFAAGLAGTVALPSSSRALPLPTVPRLRPGLPIPTASGAAFYMQEGATLVAEDGRVSTTVTSLSASFALESSIWSIGYEMNGLSTTGDWYQALATDNWPGCSSPSGFTFGYEVWDANGTSVIGPICNLGTGLGAGDAVRLTITLNCAAGGLGSACFTFDDLTRGRTYPAVVTQPDPTAAAFVNQAVPANANGYFTGPMTEVVDITSSTCRAYNAMPVLSYVISAGGPMVTTYLPWSDQFEVVGTSAVPCYAGLGSATSVASGPLTMYFETTSGDVYGPHWVAGQNWTAVSGTAGLWRFQTDPTPLSVAVTVTPADIDVGQNATVTATPVGGSGAITCTWTLNGAALAQSACSFLQSPPSVGTYTYDVLAFDGLQDYAEATAGLGVYSGPVAPPPVLSHTAVDVDSHVTATSTAYGGSGGLTYAWSGLPLGCAATTTAVVDCVPSATGSYDIRVRVTDSAGYSKESNATTLTVNPAPSAVVAATPSPALQGQSLAFTVDVKGGTPPFSFQWTGLPTGCHAPAGAGNFSCIPTVTGTFTATARVTDDSGASASSNVVVVVGSAVFGLPAEQGYAAIGVTAAIAAVFAVGVILLLRRARRQQPPAQPPVMPPGPPTWPPPPPTPPPSTPPPPPPGS